MPRLGARSSTDWVAWFAALFLVSGCRFGFGLVEEELVPSATGGQSAVGGNSSSTGGDPAADSGGSDVGTGGVVSEGGGSSDGGTAGSTATLRAPYCNALPHLVDVPTLDGVVEPNLDMEFVVPVGWMTRTTSLPSGVSLQYAAAWHETGFYFYLEVTDPDLNPAGASDPVWYGDAVEIYIDHDAVFAPANEFDAVGTREFIVGAPAGANESSTRGDIFVVDGIERPWPATQWIGIGRDTGYIVEAFVVAADLSLSNLALSAGTVVGFDLGHDVSFPIGQTGLRGNRLGQYFLQVRQPFSGTGKDCPFIDTSVFCTPTLLGD